MGMRLETSPGSRSVVTVLVLVLVACGTSTRPEPSSGTSPAAGGSAVSGSNAVSASSNAVSGIGSAESGSSSAVSDSSSADSGGNRSTGAHPARKVCDPSSVVTTTSCARKVIPAGNGSSPYGCKSDADCKSPAGGDGRCIRNPVLGFERPGRDPSAGNLLAGPPPPPLPTVCVFDTCHANTDCGPKARCNCGTGRGADRNTCAALDQCLSDTDCPRDNLCFCGSGTANVCAPADCRTDADCGAGFPCDGSRCHTPRDTCRTNKDCAVSQTSYSVCGYDADKRAWACHVVPPRPPG